jgi:hypothetical protein
MTNCSDNAYYIYYTDKTLGSIAIPKSSLNQTTLDITLLGKTRLEYGTIFNENVLHLLENFAAPSAGTTPDILETFATLLEHPVIGQLWYNPTDNKIYICSDNTGTPVWIRIENGFIVGGNSGFLSNGETIPLPVAGDGYEFIQSECVWNVSPVYLSTDAATITGMTISAVNRVVVAEYTTAAGTVGGIVNYMIMGVRDQSPTTNNVPCPSPTITPTISVTPSVTPTISVTPSVTPTIGTTPTQTPEVTATPTVTPTHTVTRTPAPGASPTPTPTVTVTPSGTPSLPLSLAGMPTELVGYSSTVSRYATVIFYSNGTWQTRDGDGGITTGSWLLSGAASDYEVTAVYASGFPAIPEAGGLYRQFTYRNIVAPYTELTKGTYYPLSTSRGFLASDAVYAPDPTYNAVHVTMTIRKITDHAIFSTITFICELDGGCFAVGTKLQTASGSYKNVENILVGDTLRNFADPTMIDENDENWKDWSVSTLDNVVFGTSTVVGVSRFMAPSAIKINGVSSTPDHVYFVFDGSVYTWKNASTITTLDKLVNANKVHVDITSIETIDEATEFVAVNVESTDTLIVRNPAGYNVLSHNASA